MSMTRNVVNYAPQRDFPGCISTFKNSRWMCSAILPLVGVGGGGGDIQEEVTKSCQKENKTVFLTETVALCIPLKARSTLGFRVASERALCIHTLKAGSTVMALLRTLVDVWDRPGGRKKRYTQCHITPLDGSVVKGETAKRIVQLAVFERRKKKEREKTEFAENTKV